MKPSRFDDLTKALATATSRRQALKTIAATTIGGLLGLGGIGTAFAKCKPNGHACGNNHQCCSGTCQNGQCVTPCTANGGTCNQNGDCCSGFCNIVTHTCVSCIPSGGFQCLKPSDCCAGLLCEGGFCF